jgi:hypothetical protein
MKNLIRKFDRIQIAFGLLLTLGAASVFAQTAEPSTPVASNIGQTAAQPALKEGPAISDLEGISIGMTDDQVKEKLGKPESGDNSGMYFSMSNGQSMQLALDSEGKVRMIAVVYMGSKAKPPEPTEVFGKDGNIEPSADGKIYKMVRYPTAGYWIAYSRLNLENGPMTTVTIQKMDVTK